MEVTNQWIYFGQNWEKHDEKIANSWKSKVNNDDLVVLPGDFSWAMKLEDTKQDFEYLQNLPGKKLLLKGNHDYWWNTLVKMRNFLKENNYNNIDFIQIIILNFEDKIITGIHGWIINGKEDDEKVLIQATIVVERSSQKGIIIGKGGKMLKEIGTRARKEIEFMLGDKVFLELWVKVQPNWKDRQVDLKAFGYRQDDY